MERGRRRYDGATGDDKGSVMMRVQFKTEGGVAFFPGLSKPTIIDGDDLPPKEAAELKRLAAAARFFGLPADPPRRTGAADYRQYTITIEDGQRSHTVRLADPIEDPDLQALVDFLSEKARPK
jgi:hypothetical protein